MSNLQKGDIVKTILLAIGVVGVLTAGAVFPGLAKLVAKELKRRTSPQAIRQAIYRLDKKGWIVAKETSTGFKVTLSKKGFDAWQAYEFGDKKLTVPKKWDQKWRMLIFDIPESKRFVRDKIRRALKKFGFLHLQHSVWVFPYECREILNLLRTRFGVHTEALYLTVEHLDNDRWLKKEFDL